MTEIKSDVKGLRVTIESLRSDFLSFQADVAKEFGSFRADVAKEFGSLRTSIERAKLWMRVTAVGTLLSVALAVARLLQRP